ncbi:MAG: outer membrane beta-barrel protein [Chitinophagaceae bacterium]
MNQKKFIAALVLTISTMAFVHAQQPSHSKFYMKVGGGYFFSVSNGEFPDVGPYPPHDENVSVNLTTGVKTTTREKVLTGSYGEGARASISAGFNFNKYLALELTFNYFRSTTNLMTRSITTAEGTNTVVGSIESNGHVRALDIAPSLVLNPGYEKWNPYMRFGFVMPVWGRLRIETDAAQTSRVTGQPANIVAQTTISRKEEIKPYPTIGFQGAMGITLKINPHACVFLEAEYRNVPVKSDTKKVTSYDELTKVINTSTGQEVAPEQKRGLGDLSVAEANTDYVTTLDLTSNTPTGTTGTVTHYKDDNRPANDLKSYINIGGLGINIGFKIRL